MLDVFLKLSEQKIMDAMGNGEFDNLPGKGKPLQYEDNNVPADLRMVYKVLKNSGVLPQEMHLRREISTLGKMLALCRQDEEKEVLRNKILEKTLMYNILMEKRRK